MAKIVAASGKVVLQGPDRFLVDVRDSTEGIFEGGEPVYIVSKRFLAHLEKVFGVVNGCKIEIKVTK